MHSILVTIDGPGGSGKSSVSRALAQALSMPHLDTGAFYRAATVAVIRAGVNPEDQSAVLEAVGSATYTQEMGVMYLDGEDVSQEIRSDDVTREVSAVSAHPQVRELLVREQRAWAESHGGRGVVEGRDIGSVVFPQADLKIYLDATPEVRAARRAGESGGNAVDVLEDLNRRDTHDSSRAASPLQIPEGALVLDTSELSVDEVVGELVALVDELR